MKTLGIAFARKETRLVSYFEEHKIPLSSKEVKSALRCKRIKS